MRTSVARNLRNSAGYHPGKTPVEYEKPKLARIARMPKYETHIRIVRSWDPKLREIVGREVEKIILSNDGKTPRRPIMALVKDPILGYQHVPQSEIIPITAPVRLKAGSPKALYRLLKKQERRAA